MVWITQDKQVKPIIKKLASRQISAQQARTEIKAIPPAPGKPFAFLDWEVEEAIKAGLEARS